MNGEIKIYLATLFWLFLIYFLGVKRYSLFFQNLFNGRPIRAAIKKISQSNLQAFLAGVNISFLMQSPVGAFNHIRSYAQSGLISFKQMGLFISGAFLPSSLAILLILFIPDLPKKVVIATLLLSFFFKIFLPKLRFWFLDFILMASVIVMAVSEISFADIHINLNFSADLALFLIFTIGFAISYIFKSYIYSAILFVLLLSNAVNLEYYYLYIFSVHIALASYFLLTSIKYNSAVKKSFYIYFFSVMASGLIVFNLHHIILLRTEEILSYIVSSTNFSNMLTPGADIFGVFDQWVNLKFKISSANVVYFTMLNLVFILCLAVLSLILCLIMDKFFSKASEPKQIQSFLFPKSLQFYSPYLYVDHFEQESKKMAAMLQNIINITLDESLHTETEALLRTKKYNLILERVKTETRNYSVLSLKKIRTPYTNQENLHLLQITEVLDEISRESLSLLNIKGKNKYTKEESKYAGEISKNYDHIFESFLSNSISVYPSKLDSIKSSSEVAVALAKINISVLEFATILKNINKLKAKTKS